jgi:thiol-disulfide isomerase/thioredoxin
MKGTIKITGQILFCLLVLVSINTLGQYGGYPELGKQMPSFSLKLDKPAKVKEISINSLKGTYFILDFWNIGCVSCVASFPKMNLKIVLVGLEDKVRDIRKFYQVYRDKFDLTLTSVVDSFAFKRFVPSGVPHLIWVDSAGVVQAITTHLDCNEENIKKFIRNESFKFEDVSYNALQKSKNIFHKDKPLLIGGNGGTDTSYVFRTLFTLWEPGLGAPSMPMPIPKQIRGRAQYQIIAGELNELYCLAYFGTLVVRAKFPDAYPDPVFSSGAQEIIKRRFNPRQSFNYSVEMPLEVSTTKTIMKTMQQDLASFFGLDANILTKKMPCYDLIVIDEKKFSRCKTTGKPDDSWRAENKVQRFVNTPIEQIINILPSKLMSADRVIISNQTGYLSGLSFSLEVEVFNLRSIAQGLKNVGLDLVPSNREFQVLEITEGHL